MPADVTPPTAGLIDAKHCPTCTCRVRCDCPANTMKRVESHPLNTVDWDHPGSRQGYAVMRCGRCGKVWGLRFQWDGGTGSDNRYHDYGFVDPMAVTERHY